MSASIHLNFTVPLISALIRVARPRTVVACSAGDNLLLLVTALRQAQLDWQRDRELVNAANGQERTAEPAPPSNTPDSYRPRLIAVDNFAARDSSMAWQAIREAGVDENLITVVQKDFFTLDEGTISAWGPIDLAWINANTSADGVHFVSTLWESIAPGGYLCLDEPVRRVTAGIDGEQPAQSVRSPIWEEIFFRLDDSYEAITLPELHSHQQSRLGIMRKRLDSERVVRPGTLQAELIELGELPVRNDALPLGLEAARHRTKRNAVTAAMSSSAMRAVYAAIVLGAKKISDILDQITIDSKIVNKSIIRLLNIGIIQRDEQGFRDVGSIWTEISTTTYRDTENLSDRQLESNGMLERIATAFHTEVLYSEAEVSKICKLFTVDFARLRRCLVDSGILQRNHNRYKRLR